MKPNGVPAIVPKSQPPALPASPISLQLLKEAVNIPDATDAELAFFGHVAARMNLDPLRKQIYMIKRWNPELQREVFTHQVGIDGFRSAAERTGKYCGQTAPQWCGPDGIWVDAWLDEAHPPVAARIGVYRSDFREPIVAVARFAEYCQRTKDGKPNRMWRTMPSNQLAKCAESLALRKAFPNELGGVYTPEEMAQGENSPMTPPSVSPATNSEIHGVIPEIVQKSGTVSATEPEVMSTEIVSTLLPFRETLGDAYYRRILREIGGAEHSNQIPLQRARHCWKIFRSCELIMEFQERIGIDPVREVLHRHGFQSAKEIPTLEEFRSILTELRAIEVSQ